MSQLSLRTRIQIGLAVKWRRFKEWLHRPVCWWKGHSPTMLEDDLTIYCERCGKVLGQSMPKHPQCRSAFVFVGDELPELNKITPLGKRITSLETML